MNEKIELLNVAIEDLDAYVKKLLDTKEYWYSEKSIEQIRDKIKVVKDAFYGI